MGWSISNLSNEVKLTKKQALQLMENERFFYVSGLDYIPSEDKDENELLNESFEKEGKSYKLLFSSDHMEHMDYVWQLINELNAIHAKGDITFGSLEGDNSNNYWGYRFDGNGNMVELVGHITFSPK